MPVLMIATYNDDNSIDVMNAAWGMIQDYNHILINIDVSHQTADNIKKRKAFTVSLADLDHLKEADYLGLTSARNNKNKFANSGLSATKSSLVDAPIINEFPLCMECELVEYQENTTGCGVLGKIVNTSVDEEVLDNNQVNVNKLKALAFDPFTHGYYIVNKRVGEAFKDGLKIKK